MKYKDWLSNWLFNYVKPSSKTRTFLRYLEICKLHVEPSLGEFSLDQLNAVVLQKFVTDLTTSGNVKTGKGLSANYVNVVVSVLQSSLKTARFIGACDTYDGDKIKRPKIVEKTVESFSLKEQKTIERYVFSSKKDKLFGVALCLYTGLRIGELLALTWKDIDFKTGLLTVSKTCHDGKGGKNRSRVIEDPKTPHSQRVIPIPKQILPMLKNLKKRSRCEYLIADGNKPVFVRSYQRTFELLLKKLKMPHKGFHALRHTFATRALECGMDVKTLSELLGHKNATVTLNRYTHSLLEHKTEMMNRLGKLL